MSPVYDSNSTNGFDVTLAQLKDAQNNDIESYQGALKSFDWLNSEGTQAEITVTSTPVEVKVGASALAGRRFVVIQPKANGVFLGFSNSVSTANGIEIYKDQTITFNVTDQGKIWLVSSGSIAVRIGESK